MKINKLQMRDYDNEIKEVFDKALNNIDSELLNDIQMVYEMNSESVNKIETINSYSGTTLE